jgi:hypothetical protein
LTGHVVECAKRHRDELYEEGLRRQKDIFQHDDEKYQWMRRRAHGKA